MRPITSAKGDNEAEYEADDDDDCKSLESDTEWEGWRRELETDVFPKPAAANPAGISPSVFQAAHPLPAQREENTSTPTGAISVIAPESIAATDEETRLLVPAPQTEPQRTRRGSLYGAKRIVVEGVAGKGLVVPRPKAYASWTSLSSVSSINSSYHSHEEYRAGEGSDTNAYKKPPLALITNQRRASGSVLGTSSLGRARSATVASTRGNVRLPVASSSAPLSATVGDSEDRWGSDPIVGVAMSDEFPTLGEDVLLPGLGGGLGNPAMFPPYADMSTTVTTITSGRQASGSSKRKVSGKRSMGSLRGSASSWLTRSLSKLGDGREGNNTTSQDSVSRQSSSSNAGGVGRRISQRER